LGIFLFSRNPSTIRVRGFFDALYNHSRWRKGGECISSFLFGE